MLAKGGMAVSITITELQILWWLGIGIVAVNIVAMLLFILFAKLPDSKLKASIRAIIFELDKFADNMENSQKRSEAIRQINDILGWRRILIPSVLIGWIIDAEVAAIRKMQQSTNTPNLHE